MSEIIRRAGGLVKLAKAVGRHHATILGWTSVPPKHVRAVAAATQIPPHELRPDLWDAPESSPTPANDSPASKGKRTRSAGAAASPSPAEADKAEAA